MSFGHRSALAEWIEGKLPAGRFVSSRNSGKAKCERDWNWRVSGMRDYDLWYAAEGSGTIDINGEPFPVAAGSCFLLRPGDRVTAEQHPDDRLTVLFIHFRYEALDSTSPTSPSDPFEGWPRLVRSQDAHWLETLLNRLLSLDDMLRSRCDEAEFDAVLRAAFCVLARDAADISRERRTPLAIRHVIRAIRENAASPLSHAELADIAGLSERYLNVLFKRYTGMTVKTFAAKARIERASRLLEESALSVGTIAESLGYADIYFFSRQFKQFAGVSPTQYRNRATGAFGHGAKRT